MNYLVIPYAQLLMLDVLLKVLKRIIHVVHRNWDVSFGNIFIAIIRASFNIGNCVFFKTLTEGIKRMACSHAMAMDRLFYICSWKNE